MVFLNIMASVKEQLPLISVYSSNDSYVYEGDAADILTRLPSASCRTAITSPPYWGLRDYDEIGQIGSEENLDDYIKNLVKVFRKLRRVITNDGTLWLNLGDSYTSGGRTWRAPDKKNPARAMSYRAPTPDGLKPKDLIGVPWRVALALQEDGWYLRSEIIWQKTNPHPESVKDRPTRSHETIFLFSKNEQYYYDYQSIKEKGVNGKRINKRTVWTVPTKPFKGAHFATFPPELIKPCVLAGSAENDFVLDPFFGAGTTGLVSNLNRRNFIGVELNADYIKLAHKRLFRHGFDFDTISAERLLEYDEEISG